MGEKTAGTGHFQIPTAPAALTAVAQSASANTLGSAVSFGNAPAALYITGIHIGVATTQTPTYVLIQVLVAASIVGQYIVSYGVSAAAAASVLTGFRPIYPPIPVANAAAITVKSASSVASAVSWGVSLECINQSNVVDDGVAVGTVTTVTNQLTGAAIATAVWQDATAGDFTAASSIGKSLYTSGVIPGAANGLFIAGTNAATTVTTSFTSTFTGNLTGSVGSVTGAVGSVTGAVGSVTGAVGSVTGAVGSVTAAVTLPSIPANWITAAGITAAALNGKGDWNIGKTGYSLTQTFPANFSAMALTVGGAVTAGTVSDKTGYSLAAAYDLAKTASQAGDAMALTVVERASVADGLLSRNVSGGSNAGRLVKQALAVLRNKVEVVAGTLTVYDTDDTTVLFTAAVTTAAGNPVSSIDPA
jgi:hypothetical protein